MRKTIALLFALSPLFALVASVRADTTADQNAYNLALAAVNALNSNSTPAQQASAEATLAQDATAYADDLKSDGNSNDATTAANLYSTAASNATAALTIVANTSFCSSDPTTAATVASQLASVAADGNFNSSQGTTAGSIAVQATFVANNPSVTAAVTAAGGSTSALGQTVSGIGTSVGAVVVAAGGNNSALASDVQTAKSDATNSSVAFVVTVGTSINPTTVSPN